MTTINGGIFIGSKSYMCKALLVAVGLTIGLIRSTAGSDAVTIGASLNPRQPQVAIDDHGRIHLTFGSGGSVFYTCSTDRGQTYEEPVQLATLKSLALGMRRGPRIAISGKSIVVAAIGGEKGGGRDGDIFAWRSHDHGKTWHGPVQVNDVTSSAREGLHGMSAAAKGDLFCVWLDLRDKQTQIFGSRSTDGGATWCENVLVYKSPDGSVCECCHPSVVHDERGGLHVMWRNSLGGKRDMFWTTSNDGGKTFAKAVKLGQGSWKLDACPMDGGALTVDAEGQTAAVWRRDKDIFLSREGRSDELKLGRGVQPWLAANKRGVHSVWLTGRPGELYLSVPSDDQPIKLASGARDPVIAAASVGRGPVVVAWEAEEDGRPVIKTSTIAAGTN